MTSERTMTAGRSPEPSTPAEELASRIAGLQRHLVHTELDGALIVQNADLFYLAGTMQQSFLYVPAKGEPTLFVRRVLERARRESALPAVVELASQRELAGSIAAKYGRLPSRCGLELDVLPVAHLRRFENMLPGTELADIGTAILQLRAIKSAYEVEKIRQSAALFDELVTRVPAIVREGMSEVELAGRIEAEARELGHEGFIRMRGFNQEMFYGHLLSGDSAEVPTFLDTPMGGVGLSAAAAQGAGRRRIGRNEPVMLDFVALTAGYMADSTRILSLGPLPSAARRAFETAVAIEAAVCGAARPGVTGEELYALALEMAANDGYAETFMGRDGTRVRFIGHGVGLELDELPVLAPRSGPLAEGMVFALEPKIILPGIGAVGIENTYHVTADGVERMQRTGGEVIEVHPAGVRV